MAQLIKPGDVKVVIKDGQLNINLQIDLNINLNQSGNVVVDGSVAATDKVKQQSKEEDNAWLIPDFKPSEKIKFGK